MNIEAASVFLAGTILYSLGFLIVLIAVVVANNIIHKHWKSFGWNFFPTWIHYEDPNSNNRTHISN